MLHLLGASITPATRLKHRLSPSLLSQDQHYTKSLNRHTLNLEVYPYHLYRSSRSDQITDTMSTEEPMAVVAPDLESGPTAHVPEVDGQSSDDDMPLAKGGKANASKRAPVTSGSELSSEDERPLVRVFAKL
jgi:hypothetical protein